jgi:hypothetical protein
MGKLIDRFSEDIDIVIAREFLGFGGFVLPVSATARCAAPSGSADNGFADR